MEILSGKKYLNENLIKFDVQLLKNFYLNKGYYNVVINSSFAKKFDEDTFELIFNINANEKVKFGKLELDYLQIMIKIIFQKLMKLLII